jgi:2-keto-4-pentenoate hydratase/2-oxohepta-3-ene-1,7-dioic acid hydratase in catechol pathway
MRIARYRADGRTEFVVGDGKAFVRLAELGFAADSTAEVCGLEQEIHAAFRRWSDTAGRSDGLRLGDIAEKLDSPVTAGCNIICVGLNYRAHADEIKLESGASPVLFAKWSSSLTGPCDDIPHDTAFTRQLDYEVELGVVIGRRIKRKQKGPLLDSALGYVVCNDVSARDVQFSETNWTRAKSATGFLPVGPWITTADEVPDPQKLQISCLVNDEVRQSASTEQMIFSIETILGHAAQTMDLLPGDLVLTGTPSGVAMGMEVPGWLNQGDRVLCEIEALGRLDNRIAEFS